MIDEWEQPEEYGEIANKVAHLQTLSMVYLDDEVIEPFRRLLAESMARICDDDAIKAVECVNSAEDFLIARSQERARKWYLQGALFSFGMTLLFTGLLWICRTHFSYFIGQNALHVLMGGLVGAIGAFTAMLYRFKTITIDASAGKYLHWFDGFTRLIVGFNAALFIALAIKADVVLGFANASNHSFALLLAFCFAAGWSEKLMPSLISRFENSVLDKGEKPKQKPQNTKPSP